MSKLFLFFSLICVSIQAAPVNILMITVDDMSADSIGVFGSKLKGTTPNIDRLASQGMRFSHAHMTVGNCMPGRNVLFSGLISHNNKVEGFYQVKNPGWPHMVDLMKNAGYFTGIRGKVSHSTPYQPYDWDANLDTLPDGTKAHFKNADSFGVSTSDGIQKAKDAGKPFCLIVNISDPHKPFWSQVKGGQKDTNIPSRIFKSEEMPVPGFLFDDPKVREELALYYSSVRRADDCVGKILEALDNSGDAENTVVIFLSDHGMPLPFAKTQLYHHSTHSPWIIRWPGVTRSGKVDDVHMVSAVDMLPTLLDIVGAKHPGRLDGRSFLSLIRGQQQVNRDHVFKEYNENAGASRDPMRAVQTKQFLYLFNPWSNGQRVFATATTGTVTYRRMAALAKSDARLAKRLAMYKYRVPEELYDISVDPDCLNNIIDSSEHKMVLNQLQERLKGWMKKTDDPMLTVFERRDDAEFRESVIQQQERESMARRAARKKRK
ncbi:MAG: sulfatase [Verrucomicrobiota bacterium]|jgi:N-sulfoglucosamine sulfohydrolase|nr:sulfatase [Verrucomicrobiota bacterium]